MAALPCGSNVQALQALFPLHEAVDQVVEFISHAERSIGHDACWSWRRAPMFGSATSTNKAAASEATGRPALTMPRLPASLLPGPPLDATASSGGGSELVEEGLLMM